MRKNPLTGEYIGLSEEAIRRYEEVVLKDEDRDVRLHGKFRYLSGRVWKAWERHVHTFKRDRWEEGRDGVLITGQPPAHWERMMLIDPHDEKPHAILWVALEPNYSLYYCYREAWLVNRNFKQAVIRIRDEETAVREKIGFRIMDPNFGPKKQGNTKTRVREDFETEAKNADYPMRFAMGDDHKALGRKKVSEMLWFDMDKPLSIINRPTLYVASDLHMVIYQIEHYVWPDKKDDEPDPTVEKPRNKDNDFPDLLHYMSLINWRASIKAGVIKGWGNAYA